MPIRNTVLYYPEFIKRNGQAIRDSLECFKKKYVLSEENEKRMKELRKNIRQYEKKIKDDPLWQHIEKTRKKFETECCRGIVTGKK